MRKRSQNKSKIEQGSAASTPEEVEEIPEVANLRKEFLDELYADKENLRTAVTGDSGSDSSPSDDELDEKELNLLVPKFKPKGRSFS